MSTLYRNIRLIDPASDTDQRGDWLFHEGGFSQHKGGELPADCEQVEAEGQWLLPGLVDLQVHFREPGFEYKETIESGAQAAFAGGISSVVVMPNTRPSLDTPESVAFEIAEGKRVGLDLMVAAAATQGLGGKQNCDYAALKAAGAVAITDDGLPVMDDAVMRQALLGCREHDLLFMQHAEDLSLSKHGAMTSGPTQSALGVTGQDPNAEGAMVERDVALVRETGARYHVLHTSTARSLEAIRAAKFLGLPVSCEASPHHLLLTDEACASGDTLKKMNPPLRAEADRKALVEALREGTVDAVATDHAPHSAKEKAQSFNDAPFGVIGLETAFAALLRFYHAGELDAGTCVALMSSRPATVLGRGHNLGRLLGPEAPGVFCIVDPQARWQVTPDKLHGRSKNSAFLGEHFTGRVLHTQPYATAS